MARDERAVIEVESEQRPTALALTREGVAELNQHRALLMEFVNKQLKQGVDYGVVPGTPKPSLYKPGAEKLRTLFSLKTDTRLSDKEIDRPGNFIQYVYRTEVSDKNGRLLVALEGSCNSKERKYISRSIYDMDNTLRKMAQKRSFVGAVMLATGASDFFTQDIDDEVDAQAHGLRPEPQRAQVNVPKATSAASQSQDAPQAEAPGRKCELCGTDLQLSRNKDAYTCPNWKDQTRGRHSYVKVEG